MLDKTFITIFLISIFKLIHSQEVEIQKDKNFRLGLYYSYAYQTNFVPKEFRNIPELNINSFGPIGLKIQYVFNNRNAQSTLFKGSLGLNINYRKSSLLSSQAVAFQKTSDSFDGPITYQYFYEKNEKRTVNALAFLVNYGFHYTNKSGKFELITNFSVGLNVGEYKKEINGVQVDLEPITNQFEQNDTIFRQGFFPYKTTPFAFRFSESLRYYFTKNLAAEIELGLGNYILSGGLVFRF